MKYILEIVILALSLMVFTTGKLYSQAPVLNVSFEPALRIEGNDRFIDVDIYLTPLSNTARRLSALEIRTDINADFFQSLPTVNGNSDFSFSTTDKEWSDLKYYTKQRADIIYVAPNSYMQISRQVANMEEIDACIEDGNCPLSLKTNTAYKFGTFSWKLLPSATGTLKIRMREYSVENGTVSSYASNNYNKMVELQFVGDNIERDKTGAAVLVIENITNPLAGVEPPEDLAGNTVVCGTPDTVEYTVTRPATVDSCVWYISTDAKGKNPLGDDIAEITATEKGEKATITWKKTTDVLEYYVQVKSVQGALESDPVHLKVTVEDFPDLAGSIQENIECHSTQLKWEAKNDDGITTNLYAAGYGNAFTEKYTCEKAETCHVVRFRDVNRCSDTVDYTPAFLNPTISWVTAPKATVARGEELDVLVSEVEGIPADYKPAVVKYHWTKPEVQPENYKAYKKEAVNKSYSFEVFADVNGCHSDTLRGETVVVGGGIKLQLSTESGQNIACKDGGVFLKTEPTGGSGSYSCKWYEETVGGTPLAATTGLWVAPTKDTKYIAVVTDEVSLEEVKDSVMITYKNLASPVVSAGEDQQIVMGTYTYLLGTVTAGGTSAGYTWNWQPADKLAGASNAQNVQTAALTDEQKYSVYVVDENGCMSKPDTVNVTVKPELPPELNPGSDEFAVAVEPENAVLCKNNSVQLQVVASGIDLTGAVYAWTPAAGLDDATRQNPVLTAGEGVASGDYFVTVTQGEYRFVRKAAITVKTGEEAPQLHLAENRMNCTGDVIKVVTTGAKPEHYVWIVDGVETETTDSTYTLADLGEHTIKVYGKNSGSTCASDTLSVSGTIGEGVFFADVTPDMKRCGDEAELSFSAVTPAGAAFKWLAEDNTEISATDTKIKVNKSGVYRLIAGTGACADTNRINVELNTVLTAEGLQPVITGCGATAELAFESTTASSFVWLDPQGKEIAGSREQNPYTVSEEGVYHLKLEGTDCQETLPVSVILNTVPVVNGVLDELTTCGDELAVCGSASEGTLYWSENSDGSSPVTTGKLTGHNETKTYYVFADAGTGCKGEPQEVQVTFGTAPRLMAEEIQTTCSVPYTLQASTTGTGSVKWYSSQTATVPVAGVITKGENGTTREYWACAEDEEGCASERVKVTVKLGVEPALTVDELQTTCGSELKLAATTTGGKLVWKEAGKTEELLLTTVTGKSGDIRHYEVYAADGSCVSGTKQVEVRFGADPEVLAEHLYTTCGKEFTLSGSASAGTLNWYSDAAGKNPLTSLTVNKGSEKVTSYYAQAVDGSCKSPLKEVRVAFENDPYVEVLTPQTACGTDAVITLQATTTGGELKWEKADGTRLLSSTANAAGVYYVYAEDGSCKSTKERVEVKFGTEPVVEAEKVQTTCGSEYNLAATASGGTLEWYDAAHNKIGSTLVTGSSDQRYYVKAVDGKCESTETEVTVRFNTPPIVTVAPEINTCENVVKLEATTTGGNLYWKKKSTGEVLPVPQVTGVAGTSETYMVYAQDGTCKSTEKEVTVHFGNKPELKVMPVQTACGGEHTLVASAADGVDVKWLQADQTTGVSELKVSGAEGSTATYWVYADQGGCRSDLTEVTVAFGELPKAKVISPLTTCGTSITLAADVTGGTAVWKKADGTTFTELTVTGTAGSTATYFVTAKDDACQGAEEKVEVRFGKLPEVIVEKEITTCEDEYTLTAESTDPAATIHWLEEDKLTPVTVAKGTSGSAKKYYVYASTSDCVGEMTEVTVHFGASPVLNVMPITTCDTIAELVAGASVNDLLWTDQNGKVLASTQVHGPAGTNRIYYVQARDGKCLSEQQAVRVAFGKAPELMVEDVQTVCTASEYELQAKASGKAGLLWYQADGVTPLTSTRIKKVGNSALVYYVEAKEGTCVSEKKKVSVLFDQAPVLNIEKTLQTTCGESLTLQASASAGEVVWTKMDGTVLDLPQVSGTAGEVQQYYAYAQDGTCESVKQVVEVRFGAKPEVDVEDVQTACGESHTLEAVASDGVLHWLESDQTTELTSTTVTGSKGTSKTYYVYAENGTDCQSELYPVTVMFGTAPMIVETLNPQTTCGTSLQLTAKATAGTVEWQDALGTPLTATLVTQTVAGEYKYYVQAKDGDCVSASREIVARFGARPEVLCEAKQTTCSTGAYTIVATATEGVLHYLDSDRKTERASATVNRAGTYYVYAQAPDCVSDTVAVEVKFGEKPELTVAAVQSTCEDVLELQASATGGKLFWEKWTGEKYEPLLLPQVAAADGINMCRVYAADSREDASCRSELKTVSLEFGAKPTVEVEPMQTTCAVSDYELKATASDGAGLHWLKADGVTPLENTSVSGAENTTATYWVYADKGACRSDKQEVTVAFGVAPVVTVLDTLTSCGTSLTLQAKTSAGTLTWLDEEQKPVTNLTVSSPTGRPKVYYVYAKDETCESVKHQVVALFKSKPAVLANAVQTTCDPASYELKAETTGGTLHWLAADKTPLTSTIVKGKKGEVQNYYVYAEDATCKSDEYQIKVEFGAEPMLEVFTPQTVCGTGEVMVDLEASATGGKLVWEDEDGNRLASTQQKAAAPATKYYYVHAEDNTCASVTQKVEVRFGGRPVVLADELQTACGESLTLDGKASGGSLIWFDESGNELDSRVVTPAQGNSYQVMAQDGECNSEKMTVNVLFSTSPVVEAVTPQTACGTQLQLKAETSAGKLIWQNANGDEINLTQISAPEGTRATYFVYAKDGGCESPKETVEVVFGTTPEVLVEEIQTACGTSHELTARATDGELIWLDADKKPLTSATVTGAAGESKDYYVYAKAITCQSEPVKVTVHFGQAPVVFADALQTTCEKSLTLRASATAGTLQWTDSEGTELVTPVVTGNAGENAYYYVTAQDGACQSTTERVEVRFGVAPKVLLASDVFTTCSDEYTLEASATGGKLTWYAADATTVLPSAVVTKPASGDQAEYYVQAEQGTCVSDKQKVKVVFNTHPVVTVTTPASACDSLLLLEATTTGGQLVWTDDRNNILPTPLVKGKEGMVGTYYVYAEDGSCQSEIKEVFVNFGTRPSVNVETEQTVCETKLDLKATATGGSVYWLKNDKSPLASATVTGTKGTTERYYVYAGDGSCAGDTVEVSVTFGAAPQLEVVDMQTSCGDVVELAATVSGGSLKWTTDGGEEILPAVVTKPASGDELTCYVQAVDGSCATDKKQVTVKFGTKPEVFAERQQTSCDTVHTLVASASAGTLVWEDETHRKLTSPIVHGKGSQTYYVYASAGKDCTSEKLKVKVAFEAAPVVNVENLQTACSATALELKATASAGVLSWEKADGTKLTATTVTPEMGDTYLVYAQDGKCKSRTETVNVQFNTKPVITVEPVQTTCGSEVELKATASGGRVIWLDAKDKPIGTRLSDAAGNTQKVYVYAEDGGCQSDAEEVTVKFGTRPVLYDLQSAQTTCATPYELQAKSTGGQIVWLKDGREVIGNRVDLTEGENVFLVHVEDESCSPAASADEKITVTLGGRPELTLSTTQCTQDSVFADDVNGMEGLTYRWFVNGEEKMEFTGHACLFTEGGDYTVKVVAETAGGCVSDTASATYRIATPLRLAWDTKPANEVVFGSNISGCVKVAEGDDTGITWKWLSPATPAITGACVNISAEEDEYIFEVTAADQYGCAGDTVQATTTVTGFGELEVTLESVSGTEICKDGSALLTATVNGGEAPYTYTWYVKGTTTPVQRVQTSAAVNVLAVAPDADVTYVVKVRDAQTKPGFARKEVALTVKEAAVPVADAGPDMTIQKGLQTVLKAGNAGGITAWEWLPVEKLAAAEEMTKQYPLTTNLSASQKYQLYVTNSEGCISKPDDMTVYVLPSEDPDGPKPPVDEGLNLAIRPETDTLCLGAERWIAVKDLLGNLSNSATYTWVADPAATLTMNAGQDSALFVPATAGDYTFTVFVEDGDRKMALRSMIQVRDAQAPQFELAATGNCQNDTVKMVYADGSVKASRWEWKVKGSVVANDADYYVLTTTGEYKVEVNADNGGCGSGSKAVDVTVNAAPAVTDLAVVDSCGRAVIEVTATGATAYTWIATPAGTAETGAEHRYVITDEGKYEVTVEVSNGTCSAVRSLEGEVYSRPQLGNWVTEPMDASRTGVDITAAVAVQSGGKADFTYHWLQPEEAKTVTEGSCTVNATLANYTFEVYASDANGCLSDTLKKSITVTGGKVEIEVQSVYGKEICQGGAAMLVAHAKGVETPCVFEWTKVGKAGIIRSTTQNAEYDTLWVEDAGDYKVQVKPDAAGAILASAGLDGLTVNAAKNAPVVTTERTLTIPAGGKTVLLATVTSGTPEYRWHWSPADKLETLADTASAYPQTAALSEQQEYRVYVTDAASCVSVPAKTLVDIDNKNGLCVAINPKNAEICKGNRVNMYAEVTCGKPTDYELEYSWLPSGQSALLDASDKEQAVFTPATAGEYTWVVEVKNGTLIAAARTVVTVKEADAPVLALGGRWDCVNDTLMLTNSGEPAAKYVWTVDGVEVAENGERLVLTDAAVKDVKVYAVAENGCQSDSISVSTQLGVVPEVEIANGAFVNYPDSVSVLRVKKTDGLTADDYDFKWTSAPAGKLNGADNLLTAHTLPMTEDVKYTFVATSKANAVCQASDTVWGYLIPKNAPVKIDKDESTGELQLTWKQEELGLADSVRVMNIKWDGYAVASAYQPKAMVKGDAEKYIIDTSKDTLEFFYINASRYVKEMGKSYYSFASDTVGYFKQWLYAKSSKTTAYNRVAYPFEMENIKTYKDFGEYIGRGNNGKLLVATIGSRVFNTQSWSIMTYLTATDKWTGKAFDMVAGNVYQVAMQKTAPTVELLLFGQLPRRYTYDLLVKPANRTTGNNYILMPLSLYGTTKRQMLGNQIPNINTVGTYNFNKQAWEIATYISATGKWTPALNTDAITIRPWLPIQIVVKNAILNWGK